MTRNHPAVRDFENKSLFTPQLDTQETSPHSDDRYSFRRFMTSGIQSDIDFNESVYRALDDRDNSTRAAAYVGCRTDAWFIRHKLSRQVKLVSARCNLRWCPLCIRTKRAIMKASIVPWVLTAFAPKFLTFTLKHSDAPLEFQVQSLYDAFRKIRGHKLFKQKIKGGIWFFQIKRSAKDGLWHPHLHCICDGFFLDKVKLSDMWLKASGGSKIVDIRQIKDASKTADYVARYASAPCRLSDLSQDDACTLVDALHGRRICGTWGTAKGVKLAPSKPEDSDGWEYLAGYREVMMYRRTNQFLGEVYQAFIQERECFAVPEQPKPPPWEQAAGVITEPQGHKQLVFEWSN